MPHRSRLHRGFTQSFVLLATLFLLTGCASWSNPVANGVPVQLLPPDVLAQPREDLEVVPLAMLEPTRKAAPYHLGAGDVLGVFVEGVIGPKGTVPPVHFPESSDLQASTGFPVPVEDDGTVALPLIPPTRVSGLTIRQAEQAIRDSYTQQHQILIPDKDRILISLARKRTHRVTVVRKDLVVQAPYKQVPQFLNTQTSLVPLQRNNGVGALS